MSFERAKQVFVEQLEPGLQIFPTVEEFEGARIADIQHRQSGSAFQDIAPLAALALSAVPIVGPVLAAGASLYLREEAQESAETAAASQQALAQRRAEQRRSQQQEAPMFDWLSGAWNTVTGWLGGSGETDLVTDPYGGGDWGIDESGAWPEMSAPGGADVDLGWVGQGVSIFNGGDGGGGGGGGMMPVGAPRAGQSSVGTIGGTMAAGALTLASVFGGAALGARFIINGIRGTVPQLWKYVRKYGATTVATGLGITVAELGSFMLQHPDQPRRRRRGISARDIRTTKRVVGFVSRMAHDIGCVRAPRHFTRRRRA